MSDANMFERARRAGGRTALRVRRPGAGGFETLAYADLLQRSRGVACHLLDSVPDLAGARVVYLAPPGVAHVAVLWGIWQTGAMAVPLSGAQAPAEWEHIIEDASPCAVIGPDEGAEALEGAAAEHRAPYVGVGTLLIPGRGSQPSTVALSPSGDALLLYTSGTTAKPKGVIITHANLEAQMIALSEAWGWTSADSILHVLPLNHVHGLVNVLGCALWNGAVCEFAHPFDPLVAWERLSSGDITVFMAVPTIYTRLIASWEAASPAVRERWAQGAARVRLMVSGSAALPVSTLDRWHSITGHVLLERYGMTEIGMALSNPLHGPRRPGLVGRPLPGVEVRVVDEQGGVVERGTSGELEVRGPAVFRGYWRRDEATAEAFRDGWFRTGDVAVEEEGGYRLLGRRSVDIIKTGGYKVSALEIEEVLREHPAVAECAVVGVPDTEWGERVAAAIVAREGTAVTLETLQDFVAPRLARYKRPTRLVLVAALPRNAMGKVTKPSVKKLFEG